jgi:nitrate/nitrite transporter NarK
MLFSSSPINVNGAKATRIDLFSFTTPQMRAFHLTWMAFFICFFAWFAAAPLMPLIRTEFKLTKDQVANINIAAVAVTILFRLLVVRAVPTPGCLRLVRFQCLVWRWCIATRHSCSFGFASAPSARRS